MERNNIGPKSKGKHIFLLIITVFVLGLAIGVTLTKGLSLFEKKHSNNSENTNSKQEETNIYGFCYLSKDYKEYRIIGLNSNGKDVELMNGYGPITMFVKNNKLLFTNSLANEVGPVQKSYYIDLNKKPYKVVKLTDGIDFYDYFDFNEKYLFARSRNGEDVTGIKRYDFETGEEYVFEDGVHANDITISGDRIYYTVMNYEREENDYEEYYSIDFNGNNRESITKEEFNKVYLASGFKDALTDLGANSYIKNNKKITTEKNNLLVDGKVVYTSSDSSEMLDLLYSDDTNVVTFSEFVSA